MWQKHIWCVILLEKKPHYLFSWAKPGLIWIKPGLCLFKISGVLSGVKETLKEKLILWNERLTPFLRKRFLSGCSILEAWCNYESREINYLFPFENYAIFFLHGSPHFFFLQEKSSVHHHLINKKAVAYWLRYIAQGHSYQSEESTATEASWMPKLFFL